MRVEAPRLMGRYAGADCRSGLVPRAGSLLRAYGSPGAPRGSGTRAAVASGASRRPLSRRAGCQQPRFIVDATPAGSPGAAHTVARARTGCGSARRPGLPVGRHRRVRLSAGDTRRCHLRDPSCGAGGEDGRPLAGVHDGLPGIHVGDDRLPVRHAKRHRVLAFFGVAGPQKVDEVIDQGSPSQHGCGAVKGLRAAPRHTESRGAGGTPALRRAAVRDGPFNQRERAGTCHMGTLRNTAPRPCCTSIRARPDAPRWFRGPASPPARSQASRHSQVERCSRTWSAQAQYEHADLRRRGRGRRGARLRGSGVRAAGGSGCGRLRRRRSCRIRGVGAVGHRSA
jgi:hypothetical protein